MNVALLTAHMSRRAAGVWEFIRQLASALPQTGVNAAVIGLHDRRAPAADLDGLAAIACRVAGPDAFGFSSGLLPALRAFAPDVVHAQGIWMYPSLANLRWHRRTRRPYLVAPHGMLDSWALGRAQIKKRMVSSWFEREHLRSASCLHATNQAEARAIRADGLTNPICIVPYGVRLPADRPAMKPAWAQELAPDGKVLLFLGRLHPKKGLTGLLHAWQRVRAEAEREGWHLAIAGWDQGGHADKLSALIADLSLARSVRLVGPQFGLDKEATFRAADAFILPSFSEGLPVAVQEAWSYRLPVLMTPHCNLPEGFAAGAALELQTEVGSIADALQTLFRMPAAEREQIGRRGRQFVEDRFSWDLVAAEMNRVYAWLAGGGAPPACVTVTGSGLR